MYNYFKLKSISTLVDVGHVTIQSIMYEYVDYIHDVWKILIYNFIITLHSVSKL